MHQPHRCDSNGGCTRFVTAFPNRLQPVLQAFAALPCGLPLLPCGLPLLQAPSLSESPLSTAMGWSNGTAPPSSDSALSGGGLVLWGTHRTGGTGRASGALHRGTCVTPEGFWGGWSAPRPHGGLFTLRRYHCSAAYGPLPPSSPPSPTGGRPAPSVHACRTPSSKGEHVRTPKSTHRHNPLAYAPPPPHSDPHPALPGLWGRLKHRDCWATLDDSHRPWGIGRGTAPAHTTPKGGGGVAQYGPIWGGGLVVDQPPFV